METLAEDAALETKDVPLTGGVSEDQLGASIGSSKKSKMNDSAMDLLMFLHDDEEGDDPMTKKYSSFTSADGSAMDLMEVLRDPKRGSDSASMSASADAGKRKVPGVEPMQEESVRKEAAEKTQPVKKKLTNLWGVLVSKKSTSPESAEKSSGERSAKTRSSEEAVATSPSGDNEDYDFQNDMDIIDFLTGKMDVDDRDARDSSPKGRESPRIPLDSSPKTSKGDLKDVSKESLAKRIIGKISRRNSPASIMRSSSTPPRSPRHRSKSSVDVIDIASASGSSPASSPRRKSTGKGLFSFSVSPGPKDKKRRGSSALLLEDPADEFESWRTVIEKMWEKLPSPEGALNELYERSEAICLEEADAEVQRASMIQRMLIESVKKFEQLKVVKLEKNPTTCDCDPLTSKYCGIFIANYFRNAGIRGAIQVSLQSKSPQMQTYALRIAVALDRIYEASYAGVECVSDKQHFGRVEWIEEANEILLRLPKFPEKVIQAMFGEMINCSDAAFEKGNIVDIVLAQHIQCLPLFACIIKAICHLQDHAIMAKSLRAITTLIISNQANSGIVFEHFSDLVETAIYTLAIKRDGWLKHQQEEVFILAANFVGQLMIKEMYLDDTPKRVQQMLAGCLQKLQELSPLEGSKIGRVVLFVVLQVLSKIKPNTIESLTAPIVINHLILLETCRNFIFFGSGAHIPSGGVSFVATHHNPIVRFPFVLSHVPGCVIFPDRALTMTILRLLQKRISHGFFKAIFDGIPGAEQPKMRKKYEKLMAELALSLAFFEDVDEFFQLLESYSEKNLPDVEEVAKRVALQLSNWGSKRSAPVSKKRRASVGIDAPIASASLDIGMSSGDLGAGTTLARVAESYYESLIEIKDEIESKKELPRPKSKDVSGGSIPNKLLLDKLLQVYEAASERSICS